MKQPDDSLLEFRAHIDHDVSTTDEVQFRKWRILSNVLLGENTHVTDGFADPISSIEAVKVTSQPVRRNVHCNTQRVNTAPGLLDDQFTHIGRENLHLYIAGLLTEVLQDSDRQGIGFL